MGLIKEKRGDLPDMLVWLVSIFILAIGLFIFAFITPTITNALADAGLNDSTEGAQAINSVSDIGTVTIQRGFFFLFVGLSISVMITSFLSRTHPIFLFLYILFLAITIVLGTYLGNAYDQLTRIPVFADTLQSQTLINLVMDNLLIISLAIGALSFIIVFAKFRSGTGGAAL